MFLHKELMKVAFYTTDSVCKKRSLLSILIF